jgi:Xaa-Pro aminopeptidase
MDQKGRLGQLRLAVDDARLDALLITHLPNIRYACGFTGSAAVLVITGRDCVLFTDGRYTQQAREEVKGTGHDAKVRTVGKSALAAAGEWLAARSSVRRIGFEASHLTVAGKDVLAATMGRGSKLIESPLIVEQLRMVKSPDEIAKIRAACHLTVGLLRHLLKVVRSGITESQVAGELELEARRAGAEQMAFPTIVASGVRSALPHGRASRAAIPARGFVVCDFGVILAGYCSDMTRTLHVGRPQVEARASYEAVREAQQSALEATKPGVTVGEIDNTARKLFHTRGLAKFFTHSTGHGVGLEIHETPRLARGQTETLQPGMVITIEPGVYLPGKWGVRIEDTVVVTETGCEILTPCPKDLITL